MFVFCQIRQILCVFCLFVFVLEYNGNLCVGTEQKYTTLCNLKLDEKFFHLLSYKLCSDSQSYSISFLLRYQRKVQGFQERKIANYSRSVTFFCRQGVAVKSQSCQLFESLEHIKNIPILQKIAVKIDYSGQHHIQSYSNVEFVASPESFKTGNPTRLSVEGLDAVEGKVQPGEVSEAGGDRVPGQGGHQPREAGHRADAAVGQPHIVCPISIIPDEYCNNCLEQN